MINLPKHVSITKEKIGVTKEKTENKILKRKFIKRNKKKIDDIIKKEKNKKCFIVATGPSIKKTNFKLIKNETIMGVNTLYRGLEELNIKTKYYAITDDNVLKENPEIMKLDTTLFFGARISTRYIKKGKEKDNVLLIERLGHMYGKKFSEDIKKGAYNGGSVMIFALQVAYSLGFKEVYLIGCDYTSKDGKHFDGKKHGFFNYSEDEVTRRRKYVFDCYKFCKRKYEMNGRKIFNATVGGNLEIFERKALEEISDV